MSAIKAFTMSLALLLSPLAYAQSPQQVIQQTVDTERSADKNDHSNWTYREEIRKPKDSVSQWVTATQNGQVNRVLLKNDQKLTDSQQHDAVEQFMRDAKAQKKQQEENDHDNKQVDDLLQLLPQAFIWTTTRATAVDTVLHFEPNPNFHPPTREARVFSAMTGELVVDNQQHRIRAMNGSLVRDVTFGGGLLGRLKQGSSFSLEQEQVKETLWQLTAIHVHLQGNALLFKSISLTEDDTRTKFEPEAADLTLQQAVVVAMRQPE